ncbi:ZNF80 protein, partial [Cnemophilus loriae]|nr:ZNF80 protein [Cnemophilus loriae]
CQEGSQKSRQSLDLVVQERFHAKQKPCKCLKYGKSFSRSSHLIRHQNVRTGEKP